jgi:hypothetical protein
MRGRVGIVAEKIKNRKSTPGYARAALPREPAAQGRGVILRLYGTAEEVAEKCRCLCFALPLKRVSR